MSTVSDHHNKAAGDIVAQIIKGTFDAGGDEKAIMVLLESVAAGVITTLMREEHDGDTIDLLAAGLKNRAKELREVRRLRNATPQGSA